MKTKLILLFLMLTSLQGWACPACEKQQPKVLRGIAHGAGPESDWDYVIACVTAVIVLLTLFYSVKWIFRPAEQSQDHIKRSILNAN